MKREGKLSSPPPRPHDPRRGRRWQPKEPRAEGDDGWPAPAPAPAQQGNKTREPGGRSPSKKRAFCSASVRHRLPAPPPPPRRGTTPTPTPMQGAMPMSPLRLLPSLPTRESLRRTGPFKTKPSVRQLGQAGRQTEGGSRGRFRIQKKWRLAGPCVCGRRRVCCNNKFAR